jgi:hypothetical protein
MSDDDTLAEDKKLAVEYMDALVYYITLYVLYTQS